MLYLGNPPGIAPRAQQLLDRLRDLHQHELSEVADTEIQNRIEHYEMAYSMQRSVPEATDFGDESERHWPTMARMSKHLGPSPPIVC